MLVTTSVIITTYKDDKRLEITLRNFDTQEGCWPFEVIVVNDGGPRQPDETLAVIERLEKTRAERFQTGKTKLCQIRYLYLEPETPDFRLAASWNMGVRYARGSQLIFCNCDTAPMRNMVQIHQFHWDPNAVSVGVRKFVRQEAVDALQDPSKADRRWLFQNAYRDDDRLNLGMEEGKRFKALETSQEPWRVSWGCNLGMPRVHVMEIGGFDHDFVGWGGEDEDLVRRLFRKGLKVVPLPECFVYHLDHPKRTSQVASRVFFDKFNAEIVRNGGPMKSE